MNSTRKKIEAWKPSYISQKLFDNNLGAILLFTDTGSSMYEIKTEDVNEDRIEYE